MRIYSKVVYLWQPDGTLKEIESESFDYEGPVTLCKDSPSAPPPPDFKGAATATAASGRTDQYTPLGNRTYTQTGVDAQGNPTYRSDINLSSGQQDLFNRQEQLSRGQQVGAERSLDLAIGAMRNPQDVSGLPSQVRGVSGSPLQTGIPGGGPIQRNISGDTFDRSRVENAIYNRATSRLDPQWAQREAAQKTQLANQGLVPGGEAYTNAMRDMNFARNDAYSSALNDAIGAGGTEASRQFGIAQGQGQFANLAQGQGFQQGQAQGEFANLAQGQGFQQQLSGGDFQNLARQQGLQEQSYLRQQPMNEFNAMRTGAQPQMPQFQQGPPGANYLGAAQGMGNYAQGLYGSQVGATNAANANTYGALSTAAMAAMMY